MVTLSPRAAAILLGLSLAGCLGVPTPEEEITAGIGDEDDGPEHNPGQPCTYCHSELELAGTVYSSWLEPDGIDRRGNERGLRGVRVTVTDARGNGGTAITNSAGNFAFVTRGEAEDGFARLGFEPVYPLTISIAGTDAMGNPIEREMRTPLHRERSCNLCHDGDPTESSAGRIYLLEPAP